MSRVELTVFDLDGTLVHLEYDYFHSQVARIFPQLGVEPPARAELEKIVRDHSLFNVFPERERQGAHDRFWELFGFLERPAARPIPGALDTVRGLVESGYEVAIATARTETVEIVRDYLEPIGINQHISIVSTFVGQNWRDKVQQLLSLCQELKIAPARGLMAGDSPNDIISAHGAGFALGVAVLSGESAPHILTRAKPDAILQDISSLPDIIEQYHESPERFRSAQR